MPRSFQEHSPGARPSLAGLVPRTNVNPMSLSPAQCRSLSSRLRGRRAGNPPASALHCFPRRMKRSRPSFRRQSTMTRKSSSCLFLLVHFLWSGRLANGLYLNSIEICVGLDSQPFESVAPAQFTRVIRRWLHATRSAAGTP